MNAVNLKRLFPRIFSATAFRLFAVYVSLFCAAVAGTFLYANYKMQGFLSHEAAAAVQADYERIAARYGEGGERALISAISERSALSTTTLYLLTDGRGRWLAGNLETVAADLWNTQGPAQFAYRRRDEEGASVQQAFGIVGRLPGDLHLIVARDIQNQEALKRVLRRAFFLGYC